MKVYAIVARFTGTKPPVIRYYQTLEPAVDDLTGLVHMDHFTDATIYEGDLSQVLHYTNPRRPQE